MSSSKTWRRSCLCWFWITILFRKFVAHASVRCAMVMIPSSCCKLNSLYTSTWPVASCPMNGATNPASVMATLA